MKSIFFGSIGVLAESSEIQRRAFNEAFKEFGLDWYWNVANYIKLLQKPGGLNRIAEYSNYNLNQNDIKKIHDLKVKHFKSLSKNKLKPRKGILEVIDYGLKNHIKIGFITTTNQSTLDLITDNLTEYIDFSKFDLITSDEDVSNRKPYPDIYNYALEKLNLDRLSSITIENTIESCESSIKADLHTLFFPGEYTPFSENDKITYDIFKSVKNFFEER
jgi:HAD superfamily hydrolase (TIGR01509 family)